MRDIRFLLKTRYTNSRALVVGINDYLDASPLAYAVSDASAIRDALVAHAKFPQENITYLENSEATKSHILKAFFRYSKEDVALDERILIFFAGHGHTRTGSRGEIGFLVPYDADMSDCSTLIRWDELTRAAELIRAKHMLFIMDACYGGLALTRNIHAGSARFLKDMMLRHSRQVLTAGKADEVVSDSGGPLAGHSVFTGHLIEGLSGKATIENGIMTASGLMAYVYGKVANDRNSNQTPHYGHFDGDGDFIIHAPRLAELETNDKDLDELVVIPFAEEELHLESSHSKVIRVKHLLGNDSSSIELHDLLVEEVKRFLAGASEDSFISHGTFSQDELLRRISRYEDLSSDLALLLACMAYWARPIHKVTLQKCLARSTDRLEPQSGLEAWVDLRWYPSILELYYAGIAAVEAKRYDSLVTIFYTNIRSSNSSTGGDMLIDAVAVAISRLSELFKRVPGYEKHYTPLSEYLFKILQPGLDNTLFLGTNYESAFDEFEVLFALAVADWNRIQSGSTWGPIGRFGWKGRSWGHGPLARIVEKGRAAEQEWEPLKAGLFGGSFEQFRTTAEEYLQLISRLQWF